jgi:hypothetical protein
MKSLKEDMVDEEDPLFNEKSFEENPDLFVKTEIRSMEKSLKRTPEGDLPNLDSKSLDKEATANAEKAKEIRKDLDKMGRD